jgi:hypothetical protein
VTLVMPVKPVMQMGIKARVRSSANQPISLELYLTIHKVPQ